MVMSGEAAMEKVRRYRAIASLHRQTAAFRPLQRWSLLDQAEEWERLAVAELEAYFDACSSRHDRQESQGARYAEARWEIAPASTPCCPSVSKRFSTAEIAAVANYVTARFGSKGSQITARDVAELRKQTSQ